MDISKRLQAVAGLVTRRSMADIGTDHGYVPLYLYEQGKIDRALACDLNKGPLEKAKCIFAGCRIRSIKQRS